MSIHEPPPEPGESRPADEPPPRSPMCGTPGTLRFFCSKPSLQLLLKKSLPKRSWQHGSEGYALVQFHSHEFDNQGARRARKTETRICQRTDARESSGSQEARHLPLRRKVGQKTGHQTELQHLPGMSGEGRGLSQSLLPRGRVAAASASPCETRWPATRLHRGQTPVGA